MRAVKTDFITCDHQNCCFYKTREHSLATWVIIHLEGTELRPGVQMWPGLQKNRGQRSETSLRGSRLQRQTVCKDKHSGRSRQFLFLRHKFLGVLRGGAFDFWPLKSCLYSLMASVVKYPQGHWQWRVLEEKRKGT